MLKNHLIAGTVVLCCILLALISWTSAEQISHKQIKHKGNQETEMRHSAQHPAHDGEAIDRLTDAQKQELETLHKKLQDEGKNREQVQTAVAELFKSWGLEPPIPHNPMHLDSSKLTDAQKQQLEELHKKLRDEGKNREQVHEAVAELLKSWGLEPPIPHNDMHMDLPDLTDAQKQQLEELHKKLRDEGKNREQVHEAVMAQLKSWGVEIPAVKHETMRHSEPVKSEKQAVKPAETTVTAGNYPNPFNPSTMIQYNLHEAQQVTVSVYNLQGQLIRTLEKDTYRAAGNYQVSWNGLDNNGTQVPSGTYLYRIDTNKGAITGKMTLTK